ncbi:MAG: acetolactate synthase small subunit [Candidatus Hydrogenedentota bacterium]
MTPLPKHTLSIYVANKPGVLVRVSQVFARRGFNIDSLVVSATNDPRFSRMTIVCSGDADTLEQIIKQCAKLVDVLHARDHSGENVIEREFTLIKVSSPVARRTEILQLVDHFKGQTVDFADESLIIQMSGSTEKLDAAVKLLEKHGIIEEVRSGKILMARGKDET